MLNEKADEAAKVAVQQLQVQPVQLPKFDGKSNIKKKTLQQWKNEWENVTFNKLRDIKDHAKPYHNCSCKVRQWEINLARLRIGHTHITHSFLMDGTHLPYCDDCLVPLTVKHLLLECPNFINERRQFFNMQDLNLQTMLSETYSGPGGSLFNYVNSVNLMNKI